MADILTQLQTCLDQLATQFYATLGYLTTYHDNSPAIPPAHVPDAAPALAKISKNTTSPPIPASLAGSAEASSAAAGQASPPPPTNQQPGADGEEENDPTLPPRPDSPRTFARRQRELARDLIIKEKQIEHLISVLPGIGTSEAEQEARIRELEVQLRHAETEREGKVKELAVLRSRLESVLGAVSVGIHGDRK